MKVTEVAPQAGAPEHDGEAAAEVPPESAFRGSDLQRVVRRVRPDQSDAAGHVRLDRTNRNRHHQVRHHRDDRVVGARAEEYPRVAYYFLQSEDAARGADFPPEVHE